MSKKRERARRLWFAKNPSSPREQRLKRRRKKREADEYEHRFDPVTRPPQSLIDKIYGYSEESLTVEELFVDNRADTEIYDFLLAHARLMVVNVFVKARETSLRGRKSGYENYLGGMNGSSPELASFILKASRRNFVLVKYLPSEYRALSPNYRDYVLNYARELLVTRVVEDLVEHGILLWYHSGFRRWQAAQSLVDELDDLKRQVGRYANKKRDVKRDDRSFHGRPNRDRDQSNRSVGGPNHSY